MSEANPTLDPIGYRCDGCGRLFKDPYTDLSAIRAAGGRSCCPERKPVGLSDRIEELEANLAKAIGEMRKVDEYLTRLQTPNTEPLNSVNSCGSKELRGQYTAAVRNEAREYWASLGNTIAELAGGKDE